MLLGYLQAAALTRRFVFMIEEDVMVARDYFRWHREIHAAAGRLFCSVASTNHNRQTTISPDFEGYYLSTGDYSPIGTCYDKEVLQTLVAPRITIPKRELTRRATRKMTASSSARHR